MHDYCGRYASLNMQLCDKVAVAKTCHNKRATNMKWEASEVFFRYERTHSVQSVSNAAESILKFLKFSNTGFVYLIY